MNNEVEILLVEDNPNDAELTIRALKKNKPANNAIRICEGEEDPDIKLPKIDRLGVLKLGYGFALAFAEPAAGY